MGILALKVGRELLLVAASTQGSTRYVFRPSARDRDWLEAEGKRKLSLDRGPFGTPAVERPRVGMGDALYVDLDFDGKAAGAGLKLEEVLVDLKTLKGPDISQSVKVP